MKILRIDRDIEWLPQPNEVHYVLNGIYLIVLLKALRAVTIPTTANPAVTTKHNASERFAVAPIIAVGLRAMFRNALTT